MKQIFYTVSLCFALAIPFGSIAQDPLEDVMETSEDFEAGAESFARGEAKNGEQYFFGTLAQVIEVDVQMQLVDILDENDASEAEFEEIISTTLEMISTGRKSLDLYKNKKWPLQSKFHKLTLQWYAGTERVINDYVKKLAEPMSRPDATWSEEELTLYDEYLAAYEDFLDVDKEWVDFQYVFADANDFSLSSESIDLDDLIDEDEYDHRMPLEKILSTEEDFQEAAASFELGEAVDGEQYFYGILSEVILADTKFNQVQTLDEVDAPEHRVQNTIDSCLMYVDRARAAMKLYKDKNWLNQDKLDKLTDEWFDVVELICKNYFNPLADMFPVPDAQWPDDKLAFYDEFLVEYENYLDTDGIWVDYQYVYAESHGFSLDAEPLDVNDFIDEGGNYDVDNEK
ncbi:MAG: hypothetical protein QNK23_07060 [Crocinitomicaceae bacterium]|nr:hypothetical protein [Crocinitomicaceae bacterium]